MGNHGVGNSNKQQKVSICMYSQQNRIARQVWGGGQEENEGAVENTSKCEKVGRKVTSEGSGMEGTGVVAGSSAARHRNQCNGVVVGMNRMRKEMSTAMQRVRIRRKVLK